MVQEKRKFIFQGGKMSTKKFHLVSWKKICLPKAFGHLRIRDPIVMNIALGAKMV